MRRGSLPHCKRRTLPRRLKTEIIERQKERCADCGTGLVIGSYVFDHRPPLALRDVSADANDPALLAVICTSCDAHKTRRDLREIALIRRSRFSLNQLLAQQRARAARPDPISSDRPKEPARGGDRQPPLSYQELIRQGEERLEQKRRRMGYLPPLSRDDPYYWAGYGSEKYRRIIAHRQRLEREKQEKAPEEGRV